MRCSAALAAALLLGLLATWGCAQDGSAIVDDILEMGDPDDGGMDDDGNPFATLDYIQMNIFAVFCTDCHAPLSQADFLQLDTEQKACDNLVGQVSLLNPPLLLVAPGDPDGSALVQRIEGILQPQMPLGEPPLEEVNKQAIKDWIADGADCGLP